MAEQIKLLSIDTKDIDVSTRYTAQAFQTALDDTDAGDKSDRPEPANKFPDPDDERWIKRGMGKDVLVVDTPSQGKSHDTDGERKNSTGPGFDPARPGRPY